MKHQNIRQTLLDEVALQISWQVKEALDLSPSHPEQAVFQLPQYRKQLLFCATMEIYDYYRITQDEKPDPLKMLHFCLIEQVKIKSLITKSITRILDDDSSWMNCV